jgi:hypothetical protein
MGYGLGDLGPASMLADLNGRHTSPHTSQDTSTTNSREMIG